MSYPEITKCLCLSTMHVKSSTTRWLDEQHKYDSAPFTIWEGAHGYFIPGYVAAQEKVPANIPAELVLLMCRALSEGCAFLRLDNDGPIVEGIPSYEDTWN